MNFFEAKLQAPENFFNEKFKELAYTEAEYEIMFLIIISQNCCIIVR